MDITCPHCEKPFEIQVNIRVIEGEASKEDWPGKMTSKQRDYIELLCKKKKRSLPKNLDFVTKIEASELIEELKSG